MSFKGSAQIIIVRNVCKDWRTGTEGLNFKNTILVPAFQKAIKEDGFVILDFQRFTDWTSTSIYYSFSKIRTHFGKDEFDKRCRIINATTLLKETVWNCY